jgi:hypothetical protein
VVDTILEWWRVRAAGRLTTGVWRANAVDFEGSLKERERPGG